MSASWHYQQQSRCHLHLPGRFPKRSPLVILLRRQNLFHLFLLLSRPVHSTLYSQTAILTPILLGFNTFNFAGASAASPIMGKCHTFYEMTQIEERNDIAATLTPLQGAKATSKTQCCAKSWKVIWLRGILNQIEVSKQQQHHYHLHSDRLDGLAGGHRSTAVDYFHWVKQPGIKIEVKNCDIFSHGWAGLCWK